MTNYQTATSDELGIGTAVTSMTLGIASIITVALRLWVRLKNGAIGNDDYLMVVALALFITCCVLAHLGCRSGLGATDEAIRQHDPSGTMYEVGLKYFFIFQLFYMFCLPFIKASVCVALLRITREKRYVVPLWGVIILSSFAGLFGFASVMAQCQPIAANWNMDINACDGTVRVGAMSITVATVSILTDWLCAILPTILLWNLNMKLKVKASLIFVLALGALASISTCVRLPYIHIYKHIYVEPDNGLEKAGNLIVWSVVECGIGVTAGSLPPLQPLLRKFRFGTETPRMKLSYFNNRHDHQLEASPSISRGNYQQFPPATPPPAVLPPPPLPRSTRMQNVEGAPRGNSLVTTCQADRSPWGDSNRLDDTSNKKLVIIKNTRIDIEYNPARPRSRTGTTSEIV
ncbi:uncharacterized protein GGS22DRAFT_199447 [Annulohypoxylon maeteangense]|uniref:uncharacterized protein n=1 Tax=Annulohypoxylon maeteangense TaxID=1927788 RepID=UPI002007386F|nr:uncharacterized protein GGS22DRAFT_199447 [Annulohypoxylon maeteangense]KAI0886035.1 hypothetical protein GGS22DRAFT_199447 [Annulohypoxylon maeteangense]